MDDVERRLLDAVRKVGLPPEEPLAKWLANPDTTSLSITTGDLALRIDRCVYRIDDVGAVMVSDHRDPRSMRSQRYEIDRPQPYMHPSIEDDGRPTT